MLAVLLPLTGGVVGCATKFVARKANPLKVAQRAGWDPGDFSRESERIIAAVGVSGGWRKNAPALLAALEPRASDPRIRRAIIETALHLGMQSQGSLFEARLAAGYYLCAAEHAQDGAARDPEFCRRAERFALWRLVDVFNRLVEEAGERGEGDVPGPTRIYRVRFGGHGPGVVSVRDYTRIRATDRWTISKLEQPAVVEGVGAPLIGEVRGPSGAAAARAFVPPGGTWLPLTVTADFGPRSPARRTVIFTLYDRKATETGIVRGRRQVLAADFSMPFAVQAGALSDRWLTLGILGFLFGDEFYEQAGLYPGEHPKRDKIPVVFVHGLLSDPYDWRWVWHEMLRDPVLRERYQFWGFYYPTSLPVPWSAMLLREGLAHARKQLDPAGQHPRLHEMVMIGHSMGGLLTKLQISDSNAQWYGEYFQKPIDQLRMLPGERATMRRLLEFRANPDIDTAVFVCVPHRGSELATNWVGKIGRMLVRLPLSVAETTLQVFTLNPDSVKAGYSLRPTTSLDSLSPGGRFVTASQHLRMSPAVKKHSIIGDRGRGDSPNSTDSVVPYWSSHLDGVPEVIIGSDHSGPEHADCARELRRILHEHLRGR